MSLAVAPAPRTALEAAGRIRAVHDAMQQISKIAEAQVLEAAWCIRQEIPERGTFDAFVGAELPMLTAERAWLMAETWSVARKSRELRNLANDDPSGALEFVRGFVEAGLEERLTEAGGIDRDAVEVLTLPARKRNARLRKLLDVAQQVEAGKDPGDAEYIEQLTRERDEAVQALRDGDGVEVLSAHPVRQLNEASKQLLEVESQVAALAQKIETLCQRTPVSDALNKRLVAAGDLLIGNTERIIQAAMGEPDEA